MIDYAKAAMEDQAGGWGGGQSQGLHQGRPVQGHGGRGAGVGHIYQESCPLPTS